MRAKIIAIIISVFLINGCIATTIAILSVKNKKKKERITPEQIETLTYEAYIYGYPIVANYKTLYEYGVSKKSIYYSPINTPCQQTVFFIPNDTVKATPNQNNYLYTTGVFDLRSQPLIIKMPPWSNKYHSIQLISLTTDNVAYLVSTPEQQTKKSYAITSPNFTGTLPDESLIQIKSPSQFITLIGRVLVNPHDSSDMAQAQLIQNNYQIAGISTFYPTFEVKDVIAVNFPDIEEADMQTPKYFNLLNFLLQYISFDDDEQKIIDRFIKVGVIASEPYLFFDDNPNLQQHILNGINKGIITINSLNRINN